MAEKKKYDLSDLGGRKLTEGVSLPTGMHAAAGLLSLGMPKASPLVKMLPSMLEGHPPTKLEDIAQTAGQYSPVMAFGGAPGLLGAGARTLLSQAIGGATHPENQFQGQKDAIIGNLIGEALPVGLRGLGKFAEVLNPVEKATELGNWVKDTHDYFSRKASDIYEYLKAKHGKESIYGTDPYNVGQINKGEFSKSLPNANEFINKNSKLKALNDKFQSDPTYSNLQDFQSAIADEVRHMQGKEGTYNAIQELGNVRRALNADRESYLMNANSDDFKLYGQARDITRDITSPLNESSLLQKIVAGKAGKIQPQQFFNEIERLSNEKVLPESHYLQGVKKDLGSELERAQTIGNISSVGLGSLLGEAIAPTGMATLGALGGAGVGLGKYAGKTIAPAAMQLAQNPYLVEGLKNISFPYQIGKDILLGEKVNE